MSGGGGLGGLGGLGSGGSSDGGVLVLPADRGEQLEMQLKVLLQSMRDVQGFGGAAHAGGVARASPRKKKKATNKRSKQAKSAKNKSAVSSDAPSGSSGGASVV
tara:strand:- start:561 stop:872 length:312 start_codon:yes stop_codon:yes gene_type:complete